MKLVLMAFRSLYELHYYSVSFLRSTAAACVAPCCPTRSPTSAADLIRRLMRMTQPDIRLLIVIIRTERRRVEFYAARLLIIVRALPAMRRWQSFFVPSTVSSKTSRIETNASKHAIVSSSPRTSCGAPRRARRRLNDYDVRANKTQERACRLQRVGRCIPSDLLLCFIRLIVHRERLVGTCKSNIKTKSRSCRSGRSKLGRPGPRAARPVYAGV